MKRGSKVTLYELMRQTSGSEEDPPPKSVEPASRFVRLPVGFLWCGGLLLLAILGGIYLLGYQRGVTEGKLIVSRDLDDSARTDAQLRGVSEVTVARAPEPREDKPPVVEPVVRVDTVDTVTPPRSRETPGGDPREPGLNYYVISHPSESKARELVDFCRENDLDAHIIRTDSGSPKVIVTPGYPAGGSSSPEIHRLRTRIRAVGVLWKRQDPGQNGDFSTYFPEKCPPRGRGG